MDNVKTPQVVDHIVIGIPHGDRAINYEIADNSLRRLVSVTKQAGHVIGVTDKYGALVSANRNAIVETAKNHAAKYVLFVDDDMQVPENGALKLMDHGKDIVAGLFVKRKPPFEPSVYEKVGTGYDTIKRMWPDDELIRADAVGGAFLLVKMSVFSKLTKPYFAEPPHNSSIMGEDIYFCQQAVKAGFNIWVDTSVIVGHVGDYAFTIKDFYAYNGIARVQETAHA